MTSRLLINEPPLQVLPTLAARIGLNEAIFLQQLHYSINGYGKEKNGKLWVYNSYKEWEKAFPFWSERTIKRIVSSLREKNILIVDSFNKKSFDKTNWYSIDYDILDDRWGQVGTTRGTTCHDLDGDNLALPIPKEKNTTKDIYIGSLKKTGSKSGSSETTKKSSSAEKVKKLLEYWNDKKAGVVHRKPTSAMLSAISARLADGYKQEEIETAINNYHLVKTDDRYYYSHKFTIDRFMSPVILDKFMPENFEASTMLRNDLRSGPQQNDDGRERRRREIEETRKRMEELGF